MKTETYKGYTNDEDFVTLIQKVGKSMTSAPVNDAARAPDKSVLAFALEGAKGLTEDELKPLLELAKMED